MNVATILIPMVTTAIIVGGAILCGRWLKTRSAPPPRRHVLDEYPPRYGRARVNPPVSRVTSRPSPPAPMSGRTTDYTQRNDTDDYLRNQMLIYNSGSSSSSSSSCDTSSSSYDSGSSSSSDSGGSCGGSD